MSMRDAPAHPSSTLIAEAAEYFGLGDQTVLFSKRRGNITLARWAIALVLIDQVGWSFRRVARLFRQDHHTVSQGYTRAKTLLRADPVFFEAVRRLQASI